MASQSLYLIIFFLLASTAVSQCESETSDSSCVNISAALKLKLISISAILVSSIIGVSLPLVCRSVKCLQPDRNLFTIIKAFASGIILATGFIHVLPDSFEMLTASCLPEDPWHKFPFTGLVAMLSAVFTLMVDSIATSFYSKDSTVNTTVAMSEAVDDSEFAVVRIDDRNTVVHGHAHLHGLAVQTEQQQLLRCRVTAMVLEFGILIHSILIGVSTGASNNTCTIKPLVVALCFHQLFEGMGLGGTILQANFNFLKRVVMVFFFSATTPVGIAIGMALSHVYKENSRTSLIIEGLLNAASSGILIYMALVDLLASDFMGTKLQNSIKLQVWSYIAVLIGVSGMSLLAIWA